MNVLLAENLFQNFLSRKTPTSAVICFLKNHDMEKKWIKSSFWMKKFEKNQILEQVFTTRQTLNQDFQNVSDFQSTLNNSSFLESEFLQHIKFWNIPFTARQILIRNFNNATGFYMKLVLENEFCLTICFRKIFQKMTAFKPTLNNSSVYGSELLQRVSFRIKILTSCRFLLWLSALRQKLNHDLYNASDFDEKTVFRKLKLENSISKNCLFGQFSP